MCEDHLHWALMAARWGDDANFAKGPAHFFDAVPLPIRQIVRSLIRRKVAKVLVAQGIGRHSEAETVLLAARDIDSLAGLLSEKAFLMGEKPSLRRRCGGAFAFAAHCLAPAFETPIRTAAEHHANLGAYRDRLMRLYFPAFA